MAAPERQGLVHRLVTEHYAALYRYAYRLTGRAADAEDLIQEAYCKAQACLAQLRDPDRARTWLFSILRNAYLHRARAQRQKREVSLDELPELLETPAEALPDVDPERLQAALHELPELFRTPIILYYFEDFSYRDIAEQMDLPIGTVMSRLARAKGYLRTRLLAPAPRPVASGHGG